MLVITGDILLMMKTSAPRLKTFSATYPLMPLTNVTTAMTAATPITTPRSVKAERSLFAQSDCRAMRMASRKFIDRRFCAYANEFGTSLTKAGTVKGERAKDSFSPQPLRILNGAVEVVCGLVLFELAFGGYGRRLRQQGCDLRRGHRFEATSDIQCLLKH